MPTLTNEEIRILYLGLSHIAVDDENRKQRRIPLLPGVRVKGMKGELETPHRATQEAIDHKKEVISELTDELKERVSDEEDEFTADDMREAVNSKAEELKEEMQEVLEDEIDISFKKPLTMEDVERIDRTDDHFPYVVSQAIDILITKVIDDPEE